jgi:hypothetical protein
MLIIFFNLHKLYFKNCKERIRNQDRVGKGMKKGKACIDTAVRVLEEELQI